MSTLKENVFRAYDVRGLCPTEIDAGLAENIGQAFGAFVHNTESAKKRLIKFGEEPVIAIGGDSRTHTPELKEAIISGLLSTGANVIDFGMLPTPLLYFAVAFKRLDGGVVVTASHNPKEYNGFKFCTYGGTCLSWETGIKSLMEVVKEGKFKVAEKEGKCSEYNIEEEYKHYISTKIRLRWMDNLKIVLDAGNGVCGKVASDLFELAGCKVVKLYCDPDGSFPNHGPDPIKKQNLADLQKAVIENKAYLGIAYDGDGDRVGFVDRDGNIMESQTILSVFAKDVLKNQAGSKIVFDVRISKAVEDVVVSCSGIPVESRVGHSYIQSAVNNGCAFGGEHTGHYFFKENFGFDDGVFASLKFAEVLAKNGGLEKVADNIPKYFTSDEVRIFCKDGEKFGVIEKIKTVLKEKHKVSEIDGAKVFIDNGWFLIRASNTEPALTIRWEAVNQEGFEQIKNKIKEIISGFGLETNW